MTASISNNLKSVNPTTLETLAEVRPTMPSVVIKAVDTSWQAFTVWRNTSIKERLKIVSRFHQLLLKKKDEVAKLITVEVGKPILESNLELSGPLDTCLWLAQNAEHILARQEIKVANPLMFGKKQWLQFEPLGVIGIISPWNYPFSIPVMTVLAALVTGNTVVLKPSEKSPLVGLKIAELFLEAGFPENIVTVINGGPETGQQLVGSPVARIIFTGSVATGIKIANVAASNITPLTLELGGKDAAIVLPDAPIERTARALIWGAFTNSGQACASIERLYIVRGPNSEALLKRMVELAKELKIGNPLLETTEIGPLIDVQQYDRVVKHVEQAISMGAKILCGGGKLVNIASDLREKGLSGYYYPPTILTEVNHGMRIMQEETFGPVLPIMFVDSIDEAVRLANDCIYGLNATVWSANLRQARDIADKLNVGTVLINDCLFSHVVPEMPWGGLKKSGYGRSHSYFGLLDLVNVKHISIDRVLFWHRLWWYPYKQSKLKALKAGLDYLHENNLGNKLSKLFEFLSNIFKAS